MTKTPRTKSTRESRAMELLAEGRIALYPGRGYAVATGTKGEKYNVSKTGCECPDFARRQSACKHITATAILCDLYREARENVKRTGKTRLPAVLAKALSNATSAALANHRITGPDDQSDLFPTRDMPAPRKVAA